MTSDALAPPPGPSGDTGQPLDVPITGAVTIARSRRLAWGLILGVIAFDQLTKWLVVQYIPLYDSLTLVAGVLDVVHIHNRGVAFGIMNDSDHPFRSAITTTLALVALAGIVYYAKQLRPEERRARLGLSLVLGGAVGNLIDRARQGYVVDFVDAYWGDWHFWAFNVADAAITVGAACIVLDLLIPQRHVSNPV
jgi:signal peptidase II